MHKNKRNDHNINGKFCFILFRSLFFTFTSYYISKKNCNSLFFFRKNLEVVQKFVNKNAIKSKNIGG